MVKKLKASLWAVSLCMHNEHIKENNATGRNKNKKELIGHSSLTEAFPFPRMAT
jgi:hypothetical protein